MIGVLYGGPQDGTEVLLAEDSLYVIVTGAQRPHRNIEVSLRGTYELRETVEEEGIATRGSFAWMGWST